MANKSAVQTKSTKFNDDEKIENRKDTEKLLSNETKEISKEVNNVTARKAVRSSELERKCPPPPDHIQKLSEPTKATFISLYNKHRNVLKPQTVGRVKEKIAEYLRKIDDISIQEKREKDEEIQRRVKRKQKAVKVKKETEFMNFYIEKCDEVFYLFLDKFSMFLINQKEIPKPLIMPPSTLTLYQNIQELLTKIFGPKNMSPTVEKATGTIAPTAQLVVAEKTCPVTPTVKTTEHLVVTDDQTKEIAETKEIIDALAYYMTEFIQNLLVEVV